MTEDALLAHLPDALLLIDGDGIITRWTGTAPRLLGWTPDEAIGRRARDLLEPRDEEGNPRPLDGSGDVAGTPLAVSTRSGGEVWVEVRAGSAGEGRVVLLHDVGGRRDSEKEKSEVIASVSHELRSPLTSIKGFTRTLLDRWDRLEDDTKKHFLQMVNADCDRVTRLVTELLDISRIESGRLQLHRVLVDLPALVGTVLRRVQPSAPNHEIKVNIMQTFPEVLADPDKLDQVITNLVENATKYTEGGEVTVGATSSAEGIEVSVTDSGDGIPSEDRERVFSKFYRLDDRSAARSGTGLGLYISRGLIHAHGGRIWVEEAPGGGARFAFFLPFDNDTDASTAGGESR